MARVGATSDWQGTPLAGTLAALIRERPVAVLIAWTCLLLAIHHPEQSLMAHDEGLYAQQARVILESGDWITQDWWGELMYDRAMGIQWLIAASYSLFGVSEVATRLPAMLACVGSVALTYAIGTRFASRPTAFFGAAILTATPIWMQASKLGTQDVPLVFFELLGIWALLKAEDSDARRLAWGALAGLSIGAAFFVKGFMVVPAAAAVLPYLLWEHRRHRHLANPGLYLGFLLSLLPTLVWFALSYRLYGWWPIESYFGKLLFLAQEDFHSAGPLYYVWNIPANAFPWPFVAIAGVYFALKRDGYRQLTLFIGFPLMLFVELSFFTTRTWYYALQLLPFIALLAAAALMEFGHAYARAANRIPVALSWLLAAVGGLAIIASFVMTLAPELVAPVPGARLAIVAALSGVGLLVPLVVLLRERHLPQRLPWRWMGGWLAGPLMTIITLHVSGLWGDYNPRFKAQMRSAPVAEIVATGPVHFLFDARAPESAAQQPVLLSFYTPATGSAFRDAAALPEGSYAWVHRNSLAGLQRPFREIGSAADWVLVQVGSG